MTGLQLLLRFPLRKCLSVAPMVPECMEHTKSKYDHFAFVHIRLRGFTFQRRLFQFPIGNVAIKLLVIVFVYHSRVILE